MTDLPVIEKKLEPTTHKAIISTTSKLFGQYDLNDISIKHAWSPRQSFHMTRSEEGPNSRNAFIVSFTTEDYEKRVGTLVPDFSPFIDVICDYLSLFFGKRFDNHGFIESDYSFYVPDMTAYHNSICDPKLPQNSHLPRKDYTNSLNLTELPNLSILFNCSDTKFLNTFHSCCKFYSQALRNVEADPEIAYLHLITCGEILSNYFEYDVHENLDDQTKKIIDDIKVEMDRGEEYSRIILNRLYQVKKKFISTIDSLISPDFFTNSETKEEYSRLKSDNFVSTVAAAYDLRSKYLHSGISFGYYIFRCHDWEIPVGIPVTKNKGLNKTLAKAPTYHGLERIIRHCLLKFAENSNLFPKPTQP
jgi:Apea-like HEPN